MVTTYGSKIRAKLDKKIFQSAQFNPKAVTIYSRGTTVNAEDEITANNVLVATTVGVPYQQVAKRFDPQAWGQVRSGDAQIALRYDTNVDVDYIITIESVNYKVVDIDHNYLPDSVVKICSLARVTD